MTDKIIPGNVFAGGSAEYCYDNWDCKLPAGFDKAWLFEPRHWAHHASDSLRIGALIRCRCESDINGLPFDFMVTVVDKGFNTVTMRPWPTVDGKFGTDAMVALYEESMEKEIRVIPLAADGKPAVRTEHLRATGWRVLGLDGYEEPGIESKPLADKAMRAYIARNNLVWPEGWHDGLPIKAAPAEKKPAQKAAKQKEEAA